MTHHRLDMHSSLLRPPFKYYGGKQQLARWLLQFVPPHCYYGEVFGGAAALLFAKQPSDFEVYNDIDERLVNLYRVLRDPEMFREFERRVNLHLYSRSEHRRCLDELDSESDPVKRAVNFFVAAAQSFSGSIDPGWSKSVSHIARHMSSAVSAWLSAIDRLPAIHARLRTVQIECLDWSKFLDYYNWESDCFYYLDPPYVLSARSEKLVYRHEMTDEDHQKLIDRLINEFPVGGSRYVMLSGYANEIYAALERAGWQRIDKRTYCWAVPRSRVSGLQGAGALKRANQHRVESVWLNYDPEKQYKIEF